MIWAGLEREQSCVAGRLVEQQRQQRAVCQSQQQQPEQRQQQYRVSLCEGDSERDGIKLPTLSTGQSALIQGSPRRPERKPTSRCLFPAFFGRGTKTKRSRGMVAGADALAKLPGYFFCVPRMWKAGQRLFFMSMSLLLL